LTSYLGPGYADADWGHSSSRRSTSGMVMRHNKSPIMWKSKMQKTTALSTADAEYCSASIAGCEVLYLRDLLHRLRFSQKKPTPVYEENTAFIEGGNHVIRGREQAKHIDIPKYFTHEVIQNSQMLLVRVPAASQMSDVLTKELHLPQVLACVEGLLHQRSTSSTSGTSVLKRGWVAKAISQVTSAIKWGVSQTHWKPRPAGPS
jgi:hypothetical protein